MPDQRPDGGTAQESSTTVDERVEREIANHDGYMAALAAEQAAAAEAYAAEWFASLSPLEQRRVRADARTLARALHGSRRRTAVNVRRHVTARPRERRARTTRRTSAAASASDDGPAPPPAPAGVPRRRADVRLPQLRDRAVAVFARSPFDVEAVRHV